MSRNPARSRPLSANVRRLMRMARETPLNPDVEKIERAFSTKDIAYCDMQGNIFMAAIDRDLAMCEFAPIFMNSQLAGVIDYSFSRTGNMEEDSISSFLRMPLLLKSPTLIVDTVMWLHHIVGHADSNTNLNMAVVNALSKDDTAVVRNASHGSPADEAHSHPGDDTTDETDFKSLVDDYEYAYWLGFIYRCECHLHEESSRMVYGAFDESFMHDFYENLMLDEDTVLVECAPEICRRMDSLLTGKLWKRKAKG